MQRAASRTTTPAFSRELAAKADFSDYCVLALPDVCAEHFRQELGGNGDVSLQMTFRQHFQVLKLAVAFCAVLAWVAASMPPMENGWPKQPI